MGERGPRGKPPELRVLEGNRGHRPLDLTQMFRPEVGVPTPPRELSKEARKAWRRLSVELVRYNLISTIDRDGFALLCTTIGRLAMVERSINAKERMLEAQGKDPSDALMDTTPNGLRVQSALYQVLNKEQAKLLRMLDSWALLPDARANVTLGIRAQLQLFTGDPGAPPAADKPSTPLGFSDFT